MANKRELASCADGQHRKEPQLTGKLVMRWRIQTTGAVSDVAVVSEEFQFTYFAECVARVLATTTFPRHMLAGDPIIFPFKF